VVIYLSGAINGIFSSTSSFQTGFNPPSGTQPLRPPAQWPTTVQQCLGNGWQNYPQFDDEASCVRYVTGGG
jgi:hypothetical protein